MRKANCVSGSVSGALVSYSVPGTTSNSQQETEDQDLDQSSTNTTTTGSLLSTSIPPARPATATGLLDNHGNPLSAGSSRSSFGASVRLGRR